MIRDGAQGGDHGQAPEEQDTDGGGDGNGDKAPAGESPLRLTAEEMAFLLRGPETDPAELRSRRQARANQARNERRRADPLYADHLRDGERQRQRRRRAAAGLAQANNPPAPAVRLPAITPDEAARRLAAFLRGTETRQTVQLRGRPDLVHRYVEGFTVYRRLAAGGTRPTRGAIAAAFNEEYGVALTPSQVQNLRDQIEGFAQPGGPWHVAPDAL
ncbi:hypothetical protein [Azospirillum sp. SYSU D00513]|uniref:hypothetical protein n=1 Tax=Azospirillum sp. SYSU D00513 TaxID=2812561 RepID=UPI001FFE31AB|nr:hypothetical protein [Azospirillum sp. SYSU D00513]